MKTTNEYFYNQMCNTCKKNFKEKILLIQQKNALLINDLFLLRYEILKNNSEFDGKGVKPLVLFFCDKDKYVLLDKNNFLYSNGEPKLPVVNGTIQFSEDFIKSIMSKNEVALSSLKKENKFLLSKINQLSNTINLNNTIQKRTLLKMSRKHMLNLWIILGAIFLLAGGMSIGIWELFIQNKHDNETNQPPILEPQDLQKLSSIENGKLLTVKNPTQVTKAELKVSLKENIYQAITQELGVIVSIKDYEYDIFSDNHGTKFETINLKLKSSDIWVKVRALESSTVIKGESSLLKVHMQALYEPVDLAGVSAIDPVIILPAKNPEKIMKAEITLAAKETIYRAITEQLATTVSINDYQFNIYANDNGGEYQELDLSKKPNSVWIKIIATKEDQNIKGETSYLELKLPVAIGPQNLSVVTNILDITTLGATDPTKVTKNEIKTAISDNVYNAIKKQLGTNPSVNDYSFDIFNDNNGAQYESQDLSKNPGSVWIKITATQESKTLFGESGYLNVKLPVASGPKDLNDIRTIANIEKIKAVNPRHVEKNELKTAISDNVYKAITQQLGLTVSINDYDYEIYSNNAGADYQPLNLLKNNGTIWVQITAAINSKNLMGKSQYLQVNLARIIKSDLAGIKSIDIKQTVIGFWDNSKVTRGFVWDYANLAVTDAVKRIAPNAIIDVDYELDIYGDQNGSEYQPVDITASDKYVYIQIKMINNSDLVFGESSLIEIKLSNHNETFNVFGNKTAMTTLKNGYSYIGTTTGELNYVDHEGNYVKIASLKGKITTIAAGADDYWFVGTSDGKVYAGNCDGVLNNGDPILNSTSSNPIYSLIAFTDNTWFASALDAKMEQTIYHGDITTADVFTSISGNSGTAKLQIAANENEWYLSNNHELKLYQKDGSTSEIIADFSAEGEISTFVVTDDNNWYVSLKNGKFYYGDKTDRKQIGQLDDGAFFDRILVTPDKHWYATAHRDGDTDVIYTGNSFGNTRRFAVISGDLTIFNISKETGLFILVHVRD